MKALRFNEFGGPEVLGVATLPELHADAANAVVKVLAASINPSDVGNVAGRFPYTTLPRVPGRDYSGIVVAGPQSWVGAEVWGTGDAGFTRDGSHAEQLKVPIASLRRKPVNLTHEEAATIGVTFAAAWVGVVEYAALRRGETLVVIGATGGVGGAAVQIGRWIGARVIGVARSAPRPDSATARMAERTVTPEVGASAALIRELTEGRGADVVLNTVGGATFEPSLGMLGHRGRLAVLASPGQPRQSFNLVDFYHAESQLFGVDTLKRDMVDSASLLERLTPGFEDGSFQPAPLEPTVSLEDAVDAYRAVAAGAGGRVVFKPSHR